MKEKGCPKQASTCYKATHRGRFYLAHNEQGVLKSVLKACNKIWKSVLKVCNKIDGCVLKAFNKVRGRLL